jgi:putative transcriptional regulator
MSMPHFHPPESLLVDYAAGTLPEAISLLVATHLTYCPDCRKEVQALEAVGGALLESLPPAEVKTDFDRLLAQLNVPEPPRPEAPLAGEAWMPRPVRRALAGIPSTPAKPLPWKRVTGALSEIRLAPPSRTPGGRTRLMRIAAGGAMPEHTHGGTEYVLVLKGGFSDQFGHYLPGDLSISTADHTHTPIADTDGDCICLAVVDGTLKLTGVMGWVVNRFVRF